MASSPRAHKWRMRVLYCAAALAILYAQLLPLNHVPRGWAGPDFLVVLTVAWAIRRPEFVPVVAVAAMTLLADFLLLRAPGLMAGLMVIARQTLRRQAHTLRDATFVTEWMTAAAVMTGVAIANRLVLAAFLVDQAPLGLSIMQTFMNVLAYPLVVFVSQMFLGIRKLTPSDENVLKGAS